MNSERYGHDSTRRASDLFEGELVLMISCKRKFLMSPMNENIMTPHSQITAHLFKRGYLLTVDTLHWSNMKEKKKGKKKPSLRKGARADGNVFEHHIEDITHLKLPRNSLRGSSAPQNLLPKNFIFTRCRFKSISSLEAIFLSHTHERSLQTSQARREYVRFARKVI